MSLLPIHSIESEKNEKQDDGLLYRRIKSLRKEFQLLILMLLIFGFFLFYGIIQEKIVTDWKVYENVSLGWFLTMYQCFWYSFITFLLHDGKTVNIIKRNDKNLVFIGFLSLLTIGLSNTSIEYLSYPTQVVFKSTKPVFVLVLSLFILKKKYHAFEVIAVVLMTIGLVIFSLGDLKNFSSTKQKQTNNIGIFIIVTALLVDGVIGNVQQKILVNKNLNPNDMIMYTKFYAFIFALVICLATSQLSLGINYLIYENPQANLHFMLYSLTGCAGELCIMLTIKLFGALITVILTSLRKVFSILLSFLIYPKPYSSLHLIGSSLIFIGIIINVYMKQKLLP